MKLSYTLLALTGLQSASALNFWLLEALFEEGKTGVFDDLLISQDSTEPGCVQFDKARLCSGYPPRSSFSGPACGVNLDFYLNGERQYIYYQSGGDGTPLGACSPYTGHMYNCLNDDGIGFTEVTGRYQCTNYQQVVNGINPCQS